jgi:Ras-related protein Rab-28
LAVSTATQSHCAPLVFSQYDSIMMKYDEHIEAKQFKVIILGDGAVGKSSICARFANDQFSQNYKQTIGVDFFIKKMHLPRELPEMLWDLC